MIENDWLGGSVLGGQIWEPHITSFFKRNLTMTSTLVDVGSNYGLHAITLHNICKKIYSFEPQKIIYDLQLKSIKKNNITNIHLFNCGVGDINEKKRMNSIDYDSSVNIGDLSIGLEGEEIDVKTLDSIIPEGFDYIKIDAQGYEKFVLQGCTKIIENYKPTFVVEMEEHQLRKFGYGCVDLFNYFRDSNYIVYYLNHSYPADHVCVHRDNIENFIANNSDCISPLQVSNSLNHNLENGVKEMLTYTS